MPVISSLHSAIEDVPPLPWIDTIFQFNCYYFNCYYFNCYFYCLNTFCLMWLALVELTRELPE